MDLILNVLVTAVILIAVAYLYFTRPKAKREGHTVTGPAALVMAAGRSIVIGENHRDREGLRSVLTLMRQAHERGYRVLGVEACEESDGPYSGLLEELDMLRRRGAGELGEFDDRSSLDVEPGRGKPRMNRHWQMREALRLGWRIVPIDPFHWNWQREDAFGYLHSREPSMAEAIRRRGPMIAICGYGHLAGLSELLGDRVIFLMASPARQNDVVAKSFWTERVRFAATVPRLIS